MLAKYCEYLESETSSDYWEDVGICIAVKILDEFSHADWEALGQSWQGKPAAWKMRCAQTFDVHMTPLVHAILVEMLSDPDTDVAVYAADTLRSFPVSAFNLPQSTIDRLQAIMDGSGLVYGLVLEDFLRKAQHH